MKKRPASRGAERKALSGSIPSEMPIRHRLQRVAQLSPNGEEFRSYTGAQSNCNDPQCGGWELRSNQMLWHLGNAQGVQKRVHRTAQADWLRTQHNYWLRKEDQLHLLGDGVTHITPSGSNLSDRTLQPSSLRAKKLPRAPARHPQKSKGSSFPCFSRVF